MAPLYNDPANPYATDWSYTTSYNTTAGNYVHTLNPPPVPNSFQPPPPKPKPTLSEKIAKAFKPIGRAPAYKDGDLPPMAGASNEVETVRSTEHKKKIVLERTVGMTRDKGDGPVPGLHTGKVSLVRTIEGGPNQLNQIGVKVEASSGSFVEIPADELLAAVKELADEPVREFPPPKNGSS